MYIFIFDCAGSSSLHTSMGFSCGGFSVEPGHWVHGASVVAVPSSVVGGAQAVAACRSSQIWDRTHLPCIGRHILPLGHQGSPDFLIKIIF